MLISGNISTLQKMLFTRVSISTLHAMQYGIDK